MQQGYSGIGPQACSGRLDKSIGFFGCQWYTSSAQVQDKVPARTSAFPSHLLFAELLNDASGLLFLMFFFHPDLCTCMNLQKAMDLFFFCTL